MGNASHKQLLKDISPARSKPVVPFKEWKQLDDVPPAVRRLARAVEGLAPKAAQRLANMLDDVVAITAMDANGETVIREVPRVPENMRFAIKEVLERTMPRKIPDRNVKVDVRLEDAHLLALKRLVDGPIVDVVADVVGDVVGDVGTDDGSEEDGDGGY